MLLGNESKLVIMVDGSPAIPAGALSIDQILVEARSHLKRIDPNDLKDELHASDPHWGPTHIVDIRPAAQRASEGAFTLTAGQIDLPVQAIAVSSSRQSQSHKVHVIERNVLEWRLDPQSSSRIQDIIDQYGYQTRVVVICSEGYTSSLAARELQRLGLENATDLQGGCKAWNSSLSDQNE